MIKEAKLIKLNKCIFDINKLLVFDQTNNIPFKFKRIFIVSNTSKIRGNHAHYKCKQFMVCLSGKVEIRYTDGYKKKKIILSSFNQGIYIPPMIWASQKYFTKNSVLLVFCDRKYENKDYIRDFNNYKELIKIRL